MLFAAAVPVPFSAARAGGYAAGLVSNWHGVS